MTGNEFSSQFDVLYNNITSNQAPGLNEYEKSLFLTKAQDELLKNYFLPQSNPKQAGFDGNQKRQMDFSMLMRSYAAYSVEDEGQDTGDYTSLDENPMTGGISPFDPRGLMFGFPEDLFLPINETLRLVIKKTSGGVTSYEVYATRQIISLSYDEYTRLMSKPFKNPLKNQAWRLLINTGITTLPAGNDITKRVAEIIAGNVDRAWKKSDTTNHLFQYIIRYIKRPKPIIVSPLNDTEGLTINGHDGHWTSSTDYDTAYTYSDNHLEILDPCELDESLHEEILQRAVELAKIAWTQTGQDNVQLVMQAGQRSE